MDGCEGHPCEREISEVGSLGTTLTARSGHCLHEDCMWSFILALFCRHSLLLGFWLQWGLAWLHPHAFSSSWSTPPDGLSNPKAIDFQNSYWTLIGPVVGCLLGGACIHVALVVLVC